MSYSETRLDGTFADLRSKGEKALALFLTAGFPEPHDTSELVVELEKAGADIIELGMPFSDPLADGPVIQQSSAIALKNGTTLKSILSDVRQIRKKSEIPIVLMGYLNPILRYGTEKFFADAQSSGVDGMVLPEVPKEEAEPFNEIIRASGLSNILLVAPTTDSERIEAIDDLSSGFLYCVSTTGITGADGHAPSQEYIQRVKRHAKNNPVLVGFGITTSKDARSAARYCDGVIVGSALIKRIQRGRDKRFGDWVAEFKNVLR